MKIVVVGCGYVGISLGSLISQFHHVNLIDIDQKKIEKINLRTPPIEDDDLSELFKKENLNLKASLSSPEIFENADFIIICTPTNYDPITNQFNLDTIYSVIDSISQSSSNCPIIIKSTIPVGFTERLSSLYKNKEIIFSPEFLREGNAIKDNQYPSRIVIGSTSKTAKKFADILLEIALNKLEIPIEYMESNEAEAVKLFANTYLAMRIAFFNELDSYCEMNSFRTSKVIKGVCLDSRIGDFYNNPSFGYGGYCLPKDTQQLLKNYDKVPNNIIKSIVDANVTRKDFIAQQVLDRKPKTVGIYRLVMKEGSDNYRESAVQGIMKRIKSKGIEVIVYEPQMHEKIFFGSKVVNDLHKFLSMSDLIVANRLSDQLKGFEEKVYTRDIFNEN